jgi:hypothetical protein
LRIWFRDLFDGKSITGNAIYSTGGDVTVYANNTAEIRNPTLDGHLLHIKPEPGEIVERVLAVIEL